MEEEVAPPAEGWPEHLKDLSDKDLMELAKDYRWLSDEAETPSDTDAEFERRRQAVIAECERRGLKPAALRA